MKVIIPTIGRKIWLWLSGADRMAYEQAIAAGNNHPHIQPLDASICYTHSDNLITVTAGSPVGVSLHASVELIQGGTPWDANTGKHCQWMPYQVGQAKAQEPAKPAAAEGFDANGSPVAAEQLSRDLTEQASSESLGG